MTFEHKKPFFSKKRDSLQDITQTTNTATTVDMSLLSDEERLYYLRTGKLPPSKEMEELINNDETLNDFVPVKNKNIEDSSIVQDNIENNSFKENNEIFNDKNEVTEIKEIIEIKDSVQINNSQEIESQTSNIFNTDEKVESTIEQMNLNEVKSIGSFAIDNKSSITSNENNIEVNDDEKIDNNLNIVKSNVVEDDNVINVEDDEIANFENNNLNTNESESESIENINDEDENEENLNQFNDEELGYIAPDENNITSYNRYFEDAKNLSKGYNLEDKDSVKKFENVLNDIHGCMFFRNLLNTYTTAARDFDQNALNKLSKDKLINQDIPNELLVKNSKSTINPNSIKNKDKIVSGKQAKVLINAKIRGAKKIFLYNSGFYVTVRPLTNLEISEYTNTLRNENNEYGKIIGGHFYLYAGLAIKKFFAERLINIVEDSNLVGWKKGNILLDNLSFHDYRTILWACASLMYKDGVDFTKICSFCGSKETIKMNLDKLYFTNFDPLKNSAYPYIIQKSSVTPEDIIEYKRRIEFPVSNEINIPNWKFILKVPSVNEYIYFAEMFMKELLEHVNDLSNMEKVQEHVRFMHLKQFAPWIKEIQSLNQDGDIDFKINDTATIFDIISDCDAESNDFIKEIENYIQSTMLTYIAFPYMKCPNQECGKVPENIVNGFVSYDIESAFFMMSVRKFKNIISRLGD